jgi:ATP-binding cassette subfamily B multidrug efflux pump
VQHLRLLWPYLKRYRSRYIAGLSLVVFGTLLAVTIPLLFKKAIDVLEQGDTAGAIGIFSIALVGFGAARAFVIFRGRFAIIATSRMIEYDLREELYRKLLRLPARYFDVHSTGDLESRVVNDVEGVRMAVGIGVMMLASSGLLFVLSVVSMLWLNARLAIMATIPLVLVAVATALLTRRIYGLSEIVQDRLGQITNNAQENFTAARVIRAFAQEEHEQSKFAASSGLYRDANMDLAKTRGVAWGLMAFLIEATIAVMLFVGGTGMITGEISKGDFVAFAAYLFGLGWPVIAMGWIMTVFQRGAACIDRIQGIMREPESTLRPSHSQPPTAGEIEFRDLTFSYSDDRTPALKNVSFKIQAGERVAIVGRTGAGKSTLVQILLGLYPVARGHVFIDGRDINDYTPTALRAAMGTVPQDLFLFSDTIESNIAFGSPERAGRETIMQAAADARLTDDLAAFPNGIEQIIGERGITLSGGQKQRTAIARALIRRPRILLLDDALSSVDVHTEKAILERLEGFLKGRTCLIITHRFSVVAKVDRILVFDGALLVEEGQHAELMAKPGFYAQLVARQHLEDSLDQT